MGNENSKKNVYVYRMIILLIQSSKSGKIKHCVVDICTIGKIILKSNRWSTQKSG